MDVFTLGEALDHKFSRRRRRADLECVGGGDPGWSTPCPFDDVGEPVDPKDSGGGVIDLSGGAWRELVLCIGLVVTTWCLRKCCIKVILMNATIHKQELQKE